MALTKETAGRHVKKTHPKPEGNPYSFAHGLNFYKLVWIFIIGCVIGAFFILIVNPMQALWFVILFQIIQQIEGNLIYPHVVGNSVNLPSIWVLVAVTIGGSVMGVAGMLLFIPLCSVLYALFRETVGKRLQRRRVPQEKTENAVPAVVVPKETE